MEAGTKVITPITAVTIIIIGEESVVIREEEIIITTGITRDIIRIITTITITETTRTPRLATHKIAKTMTAIKI